MISDSGTPGSSGLGQVGAALPMQALQSILWEWDTSCTYLDKHQKTPAPVHMCGLVYLHLLGQSVQHIKAGTSLLPLRQLCHCKLQGISQTGFQTMVESIPCQILALICNSVWVGTEDHCDGLMDS